MGWGSGAAVSERGQCLPSHPCETVYLPLSYSGESRGQWRILQGCKLASPWPGVFEAEDNSTAALQANASDAFSSACFEVPTPSISAVCP